jgi:hypothetical protein
MKKENQHPKSFESPGRLRDFFQYLDRIIDAWIMNFIEQIENGTSN